MSKQLDGPPKMEVRVEAIPGINMKNVSEMRDSVKVDCDSITNSIYFGASDCKEVRYKFERRDDSLLILLLAEKCYRHQQGYGVRGAVKNWHIALLCGKARFSE